MVSANAAGARGRQRGRSGVCEGLGLYLSTSVGAAGMGGARPGPGHGQPWARLCTMGAGRAHRQGMGDDSGHLPLLEAMCSVFGQAAGSTSYTKDLHETIDFNFKGPRSLGQQISR